LPIGPLTYFENWFTSAKPNRHWIARYLPDDAEAGVKLSKATEILDNSTEFLQKSASKHAITRAVMKLGTKRIAAALGGILVIVLSSFAIKGYFSRRNDTVLESVRKEGIGLMASKDASGQLKSFLGLELYKQGLASTADLVSTQKDLVGKVNLMSILSAQLTLQGFGTPRQTLLEFLGATDSMIKTFVMPIDDPVLLPKMLKEINDYRAVLEFAYGYTGDTTIGRWKEENAARSATWAKAILEKEPSGFTQISEWAVALEHGLNYGKFDEATVRQIASRLSPFENSQRSPWLTDQFQQDRNMERGEQGYGFSFNGLYQELAYLYAAEGNTGNALMCVDSLLKYSANNFQGDYAAGADNAANIAYVFYRYGHEQALDSFVQGYCTRKRTTPEDFYARLTGRMIRERATAAALDLYWWMNKKLNLNTRFASRADMGFFLGKYREAIQAHPDPEHRKFYTATAYKHEGVLKSINATDQPGMAEEIRRLFDQAMAAYATVSPAYRNEQIKTIGFSGTDNLAIPRKNLFIYPDLRVEFHPLEPRSFVHFYFNDAFIRYMLESGQFDVLYPQTEDLVTITDWLNNYNVKMFVPAAFLAKPLTRSSMERLSAELERRNASQSHDLNVLYLELGYRAQQAKDSAAVRRYYRRLRPENFPNILRYKEYANNVNSRSFRMMAFAVKGLTEIGLVDDARKIIASFKKPANRSSLYAFAAAEMYLAGSDKQKADHLLDSARAEADRIVNVQGVQFNREAIAYALSLQDPLKNRAEIYRMIKNLPVKARPNSKVAMGFAFHDRLYEAYHSNTALIPDEDRVANYFMTLYGRQPDNPEAPKAWEQYNDGHLKLFTQTIEYDDESS
jgi:hypothetical protein